LSLGGWRGERRNKQKKETEEEGHTNTQHHSPDVGFIMSISIVMCFRSTIEERNVDVDILWLKTRDLETLNPSQERIKRANNAETRHGLE
jgi:hypothetical protein